MSELTRSPLLAVLIDGDNAPAKFAKAIFEEIASFGEASVRRVYGDFSSSNMKSWASVTAELGLVPHHQPANTVGKNASDIALVIDAMDLLHSGRFDGFVLVSSDSDFTRLASRVREQGLDVYGMGEGKTPEAFRRACKRFILIENLLPSSEQAEASQPKGKPADARREIIKAMDAIDQQDEWYNLSVVGQTMLKANSEFDTRTFGKRKLSDLVRSLKGFETRKASNNQLEIRLKE